MRCFNVKLKNDAGWYSDWSISCEVMVIADDFIAATMKAHEVSEGLRMKLVKIAEGHNLGKDLESIKVQSVSELCHVVENGVGQYGDSAHSIEEVTQRIANRLTKGLDNRE